MITQERLKEIINYNPKTGDFVWTKPTGRRVKAGSMCGYIGTDGYRRIRIGNKSYLASRLAWLYMEGYFPENEIDHINRIKSDDKFYNLRHVSRQCNMRNSDPPRNNMSGIVGVHWNTKVKKWHVQITASGTTHFLGFYKSKRAAALVRWYAEKRHGFPDCIISSTAYQYLQS